MTRGKKVCKILKEIRQQIAEKNDIEYVTSECHFQGECQGTCPKCEAEVRYLENELNRRKQLGKAVAIAGISLGVAGAFSACSSSKQNLLHQDNMLISERRLAGVIRQPDIVDTVTFKEEIESDEDILFFGRVHEEMPVFPGGMEGLYKFLSDNLIYPKEAKEKGIQGTVVVEFVVEKDGKISNAKIVVPLHPDCDKEAIRVVQEMPDWKPSKLRGKTIPIYYNLPIRFKLDDEK